MRCLQMKGWASSKGFYNAGGSPPRQVTSCSQLSLDGIYTTWHISAAETCRIAEKYTTQHMSAAVVQTGQLAEAQPVKLGQPEAAAAAAVLQSVW